MSATNYFKVDHGKGYFYFFSELDELSISKAYEKACDSSHAFYGASFTAHLSVYMPPRFRGRWDSVSIIGRVSRAERIIPKELES